jgi:hypothetical protein
MTEDGCLNKKFIVKKDFHSALYFFDQGVSNSHFPLVAFHMSLSAHLLSLQQRSPSKTWIIERWQTCHQKDF